MATRTQWETRIRAHLGDLGVIQRVPAERIPLALEVAIAQLSSDEPREVTVTLTGDGSTFDKTLPDWQDRWSRVVRVEYPVGNRTPTYLESRRWAVLPGTSTFRLLTDTPGAAETCQITYTVRWPTPTDQASADLIPTPWFEAVAALAASEATRAQAVEYARRQNSSVAGDLQTLASEPLFEAASQLRRLYDQVVLGKPAAGAGGTPAPSDLGYAVEDQETFATALFHRRSTWTP
jgi:hypothetical protein